MPDRRERKILLLTDIHYQDPQSRSGAVSPAYGEEVFPSVTRFLESLAGHHEKFDLVAVGGDITTQGDPEGFVKFEEGLLPTLMKLRKRNRCLCIVPGNHDVKWGVDPTLPDYFEQKFESFQNMVDKYPKDLTTCLFPTWPPKGKLREHVEFSDQVHDPIYVDKTAKLIVLNINSAVRCGELRNDLLNSLRLEWNITVPYPSSTIPIPAGKKALYSELIQDVAHVTPQQKASLERFLKAAMTSIGSDWHEYFRVALVHHHLGPFMKQHVDDRKFQHMVDSHSVLELLEQYDFHMALSGHTHQAYLYKYLFPSEKQVFLVGGLTIGGYPVKPNSQGIRHILVESDRYHHTVKIKNVSADDCGVGDAQDILKSIESDTLTLQIPIKSIYARESKAEGHGCLEVTSCTKLLREGDAYRSIDYRGYSVHTPKGRKFLNGRMIDLPSTSGQVDPNIGVHPLSDMEGRHIVTDLKLEQKRLRLKFEPRLEADKSVGYYVSWVTLNAYSMDKLQFEMKYPPGTQHRHDEFVFYTPDLPISRLTLVIQFPHGMQFELEPRASVYKVDKTRSDMRQWIEDDEATNSLRDQHALRYFRTSHAYSLLVKAPRLDRSYRISWALKESIVTRGFERAEEVLAFLNRKIDADGKIDAMTQEQLLVTLVRFVSLLRGTFLLGGSLEAKFSRALDASLMIWNLNSSPNLLSMVAAIESPQLDISSVPENNDENWSQLSYELHLEYGVGIGGRTLKMNRLDRWDRDEWEKTKDKDFSANYYVTRRGSPTHCSLISIPLHWPADEKEFLKNGNIYRQTAPYAVLNVGSCVESLPGSELISVSLDQDGTLNTMVQQVQHRLNLLIAGALREIGFRAT